MFSIGRQLLHMGRQADEYDNGKRRIYAIFAGSAPKSMVWDESQSGKSLHGA